MILTIITDYGLHVLPEISYSSEFMEDIVVKNVSRNSEGILSFRYRWMETSHAVQIY